MVELKEPFLSLWKGKNIFYEVQKLQGETFRQLETRRTIRFDVAGQSYFLKWHQGTKLKEVIKNLLSLRLPVLGADREWNAIHRLQELGVDTMQGVGFGQQGINPLNRISFIITEDLSPAVSLEDYCAGWLQNPPSRNVKQALIERIAVMVRKMHQGGVNHRDCYLCHFLLHQPANFDNNAFKLSVIDLHRAQIRNTVPVRWRNKDLIGLYFSSLNIGLTQRDYLRFLKIYFQNDIRAIMHDELSLFSTYTRKTERIINHTSKNKL